MSKLTADQAAMLKLASKYLMDARRDAEDILTGMELEGVDLDYEFLALKNLFTGIEIATDAFNAYAQKQELESK